MPGPDAPLITFRNRAELRDWLAANHATSGTVWIATYKRHHPDYLAWEPLVEELLCWGWIDSLPRAIDDDKTNGMWDFLNDVEALIDPPDLTAALQGRAAEVWAAHPRSVKRGTLEWIKMAKTPATRAARIAEVADSAGQGLRPKIFRR